jgi:hypothetical protein
MSDVRRLGWRTELRKLVLLATGMALGLFAWLSSTSSRSRASAATPRLDQQTAGPQYDSSSALLRPENFETWVFVGSSTGLTYEPGMQAKGAGEFHDVYIRPESYREYTRTGKFPEKTVLVLALYPPNEKVSPAKGGYFEGDLDGIAAAVKDHDRFPEGWAYFDFGHTPNLKDKSTANPKENCYSCHNQHAADDNVFVQFYPILRPIMQAHRSASH